MPAWAWLSSATTSSWTEGSRMGWLLLGRGPQTAVRLPPRSAGRRRHEARPLLPERPDRTSGGLGTVPGGPCHLSPQASCMSPAPVWPITCARLLRQVASERQPQLPSQVCRLALSTPKEPGQPAPPQPPLLIHKQIGPRAVSVSVRHRHPRGDSQETSPINSFLPQTHALQVLRAGHAEGKAEGPPMASFLLGGVGGRMCVGGDSW